ncbi:MAG: rRNA adenine dimethyltransferase family protein [Thermoproteota archaeon]|jgi:16S rRNA (adenine1518-N6/adenine1519-N6)-dimethyltransferase|nr:rRNA adenine dimethyltransferase family protein [Thermoproteota archaeon]MEC9063289.1 rRNA adenine dimethyltransferase family protein [Thermoproteota archaeon]MEC9074021.1 rRNA adenine dimethyltransferase family protein [Thermoproteota archaeon]MEC9416624.1 rRNA adenine dimethyltransferase family protein [Thermoproteota archaeon]MED5542522.1 rRNA adenine dimethyltransferase family protein [Thermoproteota archaeon]|tara:strand:- start:251 stop:955 length:705 start_codon:yes stop_codon:yes gene_type:complete
MSIQKKLGQNFLNSKSIAKFIVDSATISKNNTVYEIGIGKGILTPYLCEQSKNVISVEKDLNLYEESKVKFSNIKNLKIIHGDGFKQNEKFDIFVSNLPYSESKKAIQWMLMEKFQHGIVMVQYDFAKKLLAHDNDRKAISVLAQSGFEMKILKTIGKENFTPKPKINSSIMSFTRKHTFSKELIQSVNLMFSFRRKKLQNIGKKLGLEIKSDQRLEEMSNNEIIKFAKKIKRI